MFGIKKQLNRAIAIVGLSVCLTVHSPTLLLKSWSRYMYPVCPKELWVQHCYLLHIFFAQLFFFSFFGSLVNETFSDLKFNVFIITGSIFSTKYVKQVVLINHSWISPTLQKGWGLELFILQKMGKGTFFSKKGEVGKIVDEWRLLRWNKLFLLGNLCAYKSKKHYNPRFIHKSNNF